MTDQNDLLQFPCVYPIKIMGKASPEFETAVIEILHSHIPNLGESAITTRHSREGKFVSITATFMATSRAEVDALYIALNNYPDVMMVL